MTAAGEQLIEKDSAWRGPTAPTAGGATRRDDATRRNAAMGAARVRLDVARGDRMAAGV